MRFALQALGFGFENQNEQERLQRMIVEETQAYTDRLIRGGNLGSLDTVLTGLREVVRSSAVLGNERQAALQNFLKQSLFTTLSHLTQNPGKIDTVTGLIDAVTYLIELGVTNDMDNMAIFTSLFEIFNNRRQMLGRGLRIERIDDLDRFNVTVKDNFLDFYNEFLSNLIEISSLIVDRFQDREDVTQELKRQFALELATRLWQGYRAVVGPIRIPFGENSSIDLTQREPSETISELRTDLRRHLGRLQRLLNEGDPLYEQISQAIRILQLQNVRIPDSIWNLDLMDLPATFTPVTLPPEPAYEPDDEDDKKIQSSVSLGTMPTQLGIAAPLDSSPAPAAATGGTERPDIFSRSLAETSQLADPGNPAYRPYLTSAATASAGTSGQNYISPFFVASNSSSPTRGVVTSSEETLRLGTRPATFAGLTPPTAPAPVVGTASSNPHIAAVVQQLLTSPNTVNVASLLTQMLQTNNPTLLNNPAFVNALIEAIEMNPALGADPTVVAKLRTLALANPQNAELQTLLASLENRQGTNENPEQVASDTQEAATSPQSDSLAIAPNQDEPQTPTQELAQSDDLETPSSDGTSRV